MAALLAMALLSSCNGAARPDVVVPMYRGEPNGDDAALVGAIVVEGPCLLVDAGDGSPLLIAFPASAARWDDAARELTLGGETYAVGDRVQFGGSAHPARQVAADWETRPSADCDAGWIWFSQAEARLVSSPP